MASHEASPTPTLTGQLRMAAQYRQTLSFSGKYEISPSRLQINHSALVLRPAGVSPGDVVALTFPANSIEDRDEDGRYLYLLGVKDQIDTAGSSQDHIAVNVGALMLEGQGRTTGSPGDGLGPAESYWTWWSVLLDALNFVSNAMDGAFVNNFPGYLTDVVHLIINRLNENRIWQLVFLAGCNLSSNALNGFNYLPGELQEVHETYWRARLIASVAVPIAVAVFTLLSSFLFQSDPEGWNNWITLLSRANAALTGGGPLAFHFMRNRGTEN